jgi:hypothetical protein
MSSSSIKPILLIPAGMLLAVIAFRQIPAVRFALMVILLLFSVVLGITAVITKYRRNYLQGRISLGALLRNTLMEISALLLLLILAGWLGRSIAVMTTQQVNNEFLKFIAGITVGLLVGIAVGFIVNQMGAGLRLLKDRIAARLQ